MFEKAARAVSDCGANIVSQEVSGASDEDLVLLEKSFGGEVTWPVTWLKPTGETQLAGTHIWAISGPLIRPIHSGDHLIGSIFEDADSRYCRLGAILPSDISKSREEQARSIFESMESALLKANMDFSNVIRTWFYNDDLLDWYGSFNKTRDDFFREKNIFRELVPASTGIGGPNPSGSALVSGLLAVEPKTDNTNAFMVPSPLQGSALDYGSSFSRAVELTTRDQRRLYISGTASIDPDGETQHLDDMDAQVDLTMRVVGAILESRDMEWSDVVRGIAYIRENSDAPSYTQYCTAKGLSSLPVVVVNNIVCRDDLLFEIEVDAIR